MHPQITRQRRLTERERRRLAPIARRIVWWQPPEATLDEPGRLIAQAMTLGTWDDVNELLAVFGEEAFRGVLANPPIGVFDRRSWNYWHVRFGIEPTPPLPLRSS